MYARYIKRALDFILSLLAIIILSPLLLILTILGAVMMKGNPFFTQLRPGKDEKIFHLVKFRSMSCAKDKNGELLSDDERLTKYGRLLRSTSLDELPELFNILVGNMAIIGPRPLLVEYLPYYTDEERKRHSVRPGLTGLAQINGRNAITWEARFQLDLEYISHITFLGDVKIVLKTVYKTVKRSDILVGKAIPAGRLDVARRKEAEKERDYVSL